MKAVIHRRGTSAGRARPWALHVLFALLLLAAAGLGVRLFLLVRDGQAQAADRALRQQRIVVPLPGRTGGIFARSHRRYVPLAVSRQTPCCFADPFMLDDGQLADISIRLGPAIDLPPAELLERLLLRRSKRFIRLRSDLSEAQAQGVEELNLPAVGIIHEWRREYPSQSLASTVVGFRQADGVPGGGLELTQEAYLSAEAGRRVVLGDASRRPIWPLAAESRPPADGANVILCLDAVIQGYLEEAVAASLDKYAAQWGVGIVVEPASGQVLAMCSLPDFNPNEFNKVSAELRANRAVTAPYEPGSVFKPIIAAGAVEAGAVSYRSEIFCENGTYVAPRGGRITDHGESYGTLTVEDGIVLSSNICMAKIGEKLGNDQIHAIVEAFGFARPTGVELAGESRGIVRPLDKWDGYSLRRVPFGQEISTTSMQLTMAFAALANGGLLMEPHLVDRVVDAEGRELYRSRPRVVRRVLSEPVAAQTLAVMEQVVERGTGKACRLSRWRSFGKTGTAQIAGPGGYVDGAFVGSFIGGAPASKPRLLCLISIYWPERSKGHYGSTVAAPYVRQVLERSLTYLNVPGDKEQAGALSVR